MRESLRLFVAACFYYSGLVKLALWWKQRSEQRLTIIFHHRATGGHLRHQLLYLRRHYRIMHLEDALEEFYMLRSEGKWAIDKRPPLVLTFDDGYRDNYTHGFPLVRELQVPITIFLIPGYIESGECFWWLEGERLVRNAQVDKVTLDGCSYRLGYLKERDALAHAIDTRLRYARSVAEREAFRTTVSKALAVPSAIAEDEAVRPLTWEEIREMEASGWVSFGGHTMHHPILSRLADHTEMGWEIKECRKVLERQLGHSVRTFAYPIGHPEDIGDEVLQTVKTAGYKWALTTVEEAITAESDPYFLPRLPGILQKHWLIMASELVGLLGIFSRMRKNSFLWRLKQMIAL